MSGHEHDRFEQLYREDSRGVLAYLARRTARPEDAADLLAEVYLIAWRRIATVPRGDTGRLWLYGVARRVLANYRRRGRAETGLAESLKDDLRRTDPAQASQRLRRACSRRVCRQS